jgi:hypothetical protein
MFKEREFQTNCRETNCRSSFNAVHSNHNDLQMGNSSSSRHSLTTIASSLDLAQLLLLLLLLVQKLSDRRPGSQLLGL